MIDLRLGDCLEVMKTIEDNSIDAIICDLPYGTTQNKWDNVIPFEPLWEQYKRVIKDNGAIVLTAAQPFTSMMIMSNPKMFKYCWVWNKDRSSGALNCNRMPLRYHEDIVVFYKKQCTYNPQMTKGKMINKGGSKGGGSYGVTKEKRYFSDTYYPRSIQTFKGCHNMTGKIHPTEKPLELMEYLVKTYTNENETVLDNTIGSGTTMLACKNLNRNGIGIEMNEDYFNIASERVGEKIKEKDIEAPTLFNELN